MVNAQRRILVWSEEDQYAQTVASALAPLASSCGLDVKRCGDAAEVLALVLDDKVDLLLRDMPQVSHGAVTALRNCKRVRPKLPVVVLTSDFGDPFRKEVLPLGIHYYLARDFDADELMESVRCALKNPTLS